MHRVQSVLRLSAPHQDQRVISEALLALSGTIPLTLRYVWAARDDEQTVPMRFPY